MPQTKMNANEFQYLPEKQPGEKSDAFAEFEARIMHGPTDADLDGMLDEERAARWAQISSSHTERALQDGWDAYAAKVENSRSPVEKIESDGRNRRHHTTRRAGRVAISAPKSTKVHIPVSIISGRGGDPMMSLADQAYEAYKVSKHTNELPRVS